MRSAGVSFVSLLYKRSVDRLDNSHDIPLLLAQDSDIGNCLLLALKQLWVVQLDLCWDARFAFCPVENSLSSRGFVESEKVGNLCRPTELCNQF